MNSHIYSLNLVFPMLAAMPWLIPPAAWAGEPSQDRASDEAALFDQMPVVQAASLHLESIESAPATVTVITERDIRTYGYRTLAEVLNSVCGVYLSFDRTYYYAGVRGFGIPGDYGTRLLVMINGHYMRDNILMGNSYFGEDFGLDLELVERIEVLRGPSSALYGSNGILMTVNIITRSPLKHPGVQGTVETGSFGQKRIQASASVSLPRGASLLVSGSVFDNSGQTLFFPAFNSPETNHGIVSGSDGERGYHAFLNLHWKNWDITGMFNDRRKQMPAGWEVMPFDGDETAYDSRNFIEAAYSRDVGATGNLSWRLSYDWQRYHANLLEFSSGDGVLSRDIERGDWLGSRLTYRFDLSRVGTLTVGAEATVDLQTLQQEYELPLTSYLVNVNQPEATFGLFAQVERKLGSRWKTVLGLRLDKASYGSNFLSPRMALLYEASPKTTYKILYGRAFRSPSAYERYYGDGSYQSANPGLQPEGAHTAELSVVRKLTPALRATVSGYYYRLNSLIQSVLLPSGLLQFQNASRDSSLGLEAELSGRIGHRVETGAGIALQHSHGSMGTLENSPEILGKVRLAVPFASNRFKLSSSGSYLGARRTLAGATAGAAFVWDVTASTHRLHPSFDLVVGMRNVLDRKYYFPTALVADQVPADGRAFFLRCIFGSRE